MLIDKRKLQAMHYVHGTTPTPHKCKECCNFRTFEYHGKRYFKCAAYGISNSAATDWGANYLACGLFNIQIDNQLPLLEQIIHQSRKLPAIPLDGQIEMEIFT